jgi:hypothetical protein
MRLVKNPLLWGAILGALAYVFWYGTVMLDPTHVDWLAFGDRATTFLGWHFFRHEPWTFPLAMIRNYGEGLNTSLIVTDSIPLAGLLLKPISGLLPDAFQFLGLWGLACYVLTATFAYAITSRFTTHPVARVVGAALVVMAPFVTWRGIWHFSLVAQWLYLAAIWLYLACEQRAWWTKWAALLVASALINPYVFVAVAVIWIAALVDQARRRPDRDARKALLRVAIVTVAVVTAACWVAGTFAAAGYAGQLSGFGATRFDLAGWFDSRGSSRVHHGWIMGTPDGGEGYQYLGMGGCFAILAGIVLWLQRPVAPGGRLAMLLAATLALLIFAVSNRVSIGGVVLFEVPLPDALFRLASVFRSSGRMAVVAGYLLLIAAVAMIGERMPARIATGVLVALLALNVFDVSVSRPSIQAAVAPRPVENKQAQIELVSSLPPEHRRLKSVPLYHVYVDNVQQIFGYALAAGSRNMSMNMAYLGRFDHDTFTARSNAVLREALEGPADRGAIYVTRNPAIVGAMRSIDASGAYTRVGADWIVAPGAASLAGKTFSGRSWQPLSSWAPSPGPLDVSFGTGGDGRFFALSGWSHPHDWGTWSDGPEARLLLPIPAGRPAKLRALALGYSSDGAQEIDVLVGDRRIAQWRLERSPQPSWLEATIPGDLLGTVGVEVVLRIRRPQQPSAADPMSKDTRHLGIALSRLTLE